MKNKRRGSALLIVLGMVAFMVVSAVAFSAYMRSTRLPSSYLRRSISSRMLLKAALSEAINEVDNAIGNMPHPNVWNDSDLNGANNRYRSSSLLSTSTASNRNIWVGRVYIGNRQDQSRSQREDHLIDQNDTISTLCLEALVYLPPSLINEVRYYSRHSNAATWKDLPFDSGRYAFTAVDVSDYVDINAVYANRARSSAASDRISLAYLLESDHQQGSYSIAPEDWDDTFMKQFRGDQSKVPLISLADYNFSVYSLSADLSPVYKYLSGSASDVYDASLTTARKCANYPFVTDSYLTTTNVLKDLTLDVNQPFLPADLEEGLNFQSIVDYTKCETAWKTYRRGMGFTGLLMLYDYLDADRVPISLAIPTVERTPMVCAIEPKVESQGSGSIVSDKQANDPLVYGQEERSSDGKTKTRPATWDPTYSLKTGISKPTMRALIAYPFRHNDGDVNKRDLTVSGRMAFFLTTGSMTLRTSGSDVLHYTKDPELAETKQENSVIKIPLVCSDYATAQWKSIAEDISDEQSAVGVANFSSQQPMETDSVLGEIPLVKVVSSVKQTATKNDDGTWGEWDPKDDDIKTDVQYIVAESVDPNYKVKTECKMIPLKQDGSENSSDFAGSELIQKIKNGSSISLNAAVWIRIDYDDPDRGKKTVDFVPACISDDCKLNLNTSSDVLSGFEMFYGTHYPLLRFDAGIDIKLGLKPEVDNTRHTIAFSPSAIAVADPRYNYAPEAWYDCGNALPSKSDWVNTYSCAKVGNRTGDIFMNTSDQCRLQSIYELSELPRLTDALAQFPLRTSLYGMGSSGGESLGLPENCGYNGGGSIAKKFVDTAFNTLAWRTYSPLPGQNGVADGDDFELLGFTSGDRGYRINPYSDNTNIVMLALANTPYDWFCAAGRIDSVSDNAESFNQNFAWNEYAQNGPKLAHEDLQELAGAVMEATRKYDNFDDAFLELQTNGKGWYEQNSSDQFSRLCGIDLQEDDLYNTDKKFLYGYWRECFAVQQQLFLIFVRAEPTMMGGGALHQTPPQLGGRAVALVWRDPTNSGFSSDKLPRPHRTRVLFYRQFE